MPTSIDRLAALHNLNQLVASKWLEESLSCDPKLTMTQAIVIRAIAAAEATGELPSQTQVCTETGVDRSTLADVVRRLVKRGLIQRRRNQQDTRAYKLRVTPEGIDALADAQRIADRVAQLVKSDVQTVLAGIVETKPAKRRPAKIPA